MNVALLPAALAVVLWGLSFVATKMALAELSPMAVVIGRTLLALLFLVVIAGLRGRSLRPPVGLWPRLLLAGFLGVFLHMLLQAWGLTMTTAVRTGWLIGIIPVWSALLALVVLGEGLGRRKLAGLGLGFLGVAALLGTGGSVGPGLLPTTKGDLLILASTLNWAIYTVLGRTILARMGALEATTIAMAVGLGMLLPFAPWQTLARQYGSVSAAAGGAVVFVGVGCSGLAYLCWYTSLARASASSVASLLYLEPLVTLAGGVLLLGEASVSPRRVRVCSCWLVSILCKRRIHDAGGRTGGFGRHEVSGRVAP
ncbi:MAG: DMT family transporter [Candidatus Latescibacterota bacterium]